MKLQVGKLYRPIRQFWVGRVGSAMKAAEPAVLVDVGDIVMCIKEVGGDDHGLLLVRDTVYKFSKTGAIEYAPENYFRRVP